MTKMKTPFFPAFKVISINDKELIEEIDNQFDDFSDFNFVSLFTWNVNRSSMYSIKNDSLIIKLRDYGSKESTYSIMGKNVNEEMLNELKTVERCKRLDLVPEPVANKIKNKSCHEDRDNFDYLYDIEKLVSLDGSEYRKFRRALNNFRSKNTMNFKWEKINPKDSGSILQIIELSKKWKTIRGRSFGESSNEYYAIKRALKFAEELNIDIRCVKSGSDILGYTITENIGENCILHFEKCDTRIPGLGYFLKYQTIVSLSSEGIKQLNYEQDLGIPGLRQAKTSMNPQGFLKKYSITL